VNEGAIRQPSPAKGVIMSDLRRIDNIEDFVDVWARSQLSTPEEASRVLTAYRQDFLPASQMPDTISSLCVYLASQGVLSPWQCEMLRSSKWKGRRPLLKKRSGLLIKQAFSALDESTLNSLKRLPQMLCVLKAK
jgi:hypothetical protein